MHFHQNKINELMDEIDKLKRENQKLKTELNNAHDISRSYPQNINKNQYDIVERLYTGFFKESKSIILLIDSETGNIIDANESACEFYGYKRNEILKMSISQINILSNQEIKKHMNNAKQKKENKFSFKHRLANEEVRDVEVTSGPVEINNKIYFYSVIFDVTEKNKNLRLLKQSEQRYKQLFNNILDAVYFYKIDNNGVPGKFIDVNENAYSRLGYTREEILNMSPLDIDIRPEKEILDIIDLTNKNPNESFETIHICKDGRYLPVEIKSHTYDIEGERFKVSVCRDISRRKKAQKELRDNLEKLDKIMAFLPDAVLIIQRNKIKFANEYARKLLGYCSIEELIGKNFLSIIDSTHHKSVRKRIRKILDGKIAPPIERKYFKKDGGFINIEATGIKIPYENSSASLIVVRDITERKKVEIFKKQITEKQREIEESRRYDELKTQFFSTISHELKTPLNIILGVVQLLEIKQLEDSSNSHDNFSRYLKMMKQNCYRLLRLINNLIDINRLDSGFMKINHNNCNIVEIIENITSSVADYIERHGIKLIFDTEIEEKMIQCDVDKIERIMLNLLSNATKFTEQGGLISVNIHDKEDGVIISVKDTGIGIPKEKLSNIFDRFEQVDSSFKRKKEGSGIGLSLVKSLIEAHKGNISVESQLNKGSEFRIELPMIQTDDLEYVHDEVAITSDINVERIHIEFSDIYS